MSVTPLSRRVRPIPVAAIRETEIGLRVSYDEQALAELGDSLESEGLIYPIVVAERGEDAYELIIGSRRLRAAKLKQLEEIEAVVLGQASPLNLLLMALAENLQRQDLNPFEEGRAFLRLMRDYGLGTQELAQRVKKTEHYVRLRLELLSMPEQVQEQVAAKKLNLNVVNVIARLPDSVDQIHYAGEAVRNRLNPDELRLKIRRESEDPKQTPRQSPLELTAEKIRVRVEMFTGWLKNVPAKTDLKTFNAAEQDDLGRSLYLAESALRSLRGLLTVEESRYRPQETHPRASAHHPRNFGEVWPAGDVARIMAPNRPPDEILAVELGRSVEAIKDRRQMTRRQERASRRG